MLFGLTERQIAKTNRPTVELIDHRTYLGKHIVLITAYRHVLYAFAEGKSILDDVLQVFELGSKAEEGGRTDIHDGIWS